MEIKNKNKKKINKSHGKKKGFGVLFWVQVSPCYWLASVDFIYLSHTTNMGICIPTLAGRTVVWMQQKHAYLFKREDLPAP